MSKFDEKIKDFWLWFDAEKLQIERIVAGEDDENPTALSDQLDELVLAFGPLKWQLESKDNGNFQFIVSPNNDSDLLRITSLLIKSAPAYKNWEFHDAIPATGELTTFLYDDEMDVQKVTAENWQCVIENESNLLHLIVRVDQTDHLDEETEMVAVDLLLNAILGERTKIKFIESFEIVDEIDKSDRPKAFPFSQLDDQIRTIVNS